MKPGNIKTMLCFKAKENWMVGVVAAQVRHRHRPLKTCARWGVYPNPANEKIYFVVNDNLGTCLVLKIFDSSGKLINEKKINGLIQNIDCRVMRQGNYCYKIVDADKTVLTGKFSVIH